MAQQESNQGLYSVEQAAAHLGGLSPHTLRKHIQGGRVKVVRIGRRVLVNQAELDRISRSGLPSLGKNLKAVTR